ncbi:MAG: hypothetical protein ACRDOI_40250 [Trebonia sp.]
MSILAGAITGDRQIGGGPCLGHTNDQHVEQSAEQRNNRRIRKEEADLNFRQTIDEGRDAATGQASAGGMQLSSM